ncbi:hypothetical protein KIN20_011375 [Parelaphostrongylus tenuis]|uniref:Uncharacterized protein n=1 Tax=Parelaphostrongylus tenuis TaxID=148309 RepID=A0AAD5MVA1_PARTN|nr:hypothetical protein KIN20_011375 [Parelaphostrongylus tenuis]
MKPHCIIVGSTVTALCDIDLAGGDKTCDLSMNKDFKSVTDDYKSISGTLTTTNIIMANWSKEMWQGMLNRAVRMLASGSTGSHFFSAVATIG